MRVYVMVGAPGAGKGTQAAALAKRLRIPHVASGDLFRDHAKRGTAVGKKVKSYLDHGSLVPDDITVDMIKARLSEPDAAHGVILDGFPRTRPQAEALDKMLDRLGGVVAQALYVDVDRDELIRRLFARQREDDKPETIRARLEQQLPPMYEVIDYYTDRGVLSNVQGDKAIDEVTDELMRTIDQPAHAGDGRTPAATPAAERIARSGRKGDGCHPVNREVTGPRRVAGGGPAKESVRRGGNP